MKSLIAGIVLIVLIGVAGFFYRNALEHPTNPGGEQVACTMEAKMCPDGSSVGRSGPNCEFAACPLPNAEDSAIGIAFVIPQGYVANASPIGADETLRAVFDKPSMSQNVPHTITIRRYPIPAGKTANDVIIANTRFQPSDMPAEDMERFDPVIINGTTFQSVVIERFEAQIESAYFLARAHDVLRFTIIERDVTDWMEPTLSIKSLPEHAALLSLLSSLQTTK